MEQLIAWCAGIDVGQAGSVVCVRVPDAVTGAPAELIATTTCWRTTSRCCWSTPPASNTCPAAGRTRCCLDSSAARSRAADRELRATPTGARAA
jgi:hypothetical protein